MSLKPACLHCSFSDKKLEEYLQFRKCKASKVPKKICRTTGWTLTRWIVGCGKQHTFVTSEKEILDVETSKYIWIGEAHNGSGC